MMSNTQNSQKWHTKLFSVFRHPSWIGVMVAILIPFATTLYQDFKDRVSFSYSIIDTSPLTDQDTIDENWSISYGDKPVNNPYSFIYRFENTGRVDIKPEYFEEDIYGNKTPIIINFGPSNEILNVLPSVPAGGSVDLRESIKTKKDRGNPLVTHEVDNGDHKVSISPFLLRPREAINVRVIVDSPNVNDIRPPTTRIAGTDSTRNIERFFLTTEKHGLFLPTFINIPKIVIFLIISGFAGLMVLPVRAYSLIPNVVKVDTLTSYMICCSVTFGIVGILTVILG